LDARERNSAWIVLGLIILSALSAAVMVGSVMPFLAVLADPARIEGTPALVWAYDFFGFTSVYGFLVGLGLASFAVIVFSSLIQIVRTWALARFAMMRIHSISLRLLTRYLAQPYAFFLNRHSGEMGPRVLAESEQVVREFFQPAANLIASGLTTLAIVGLLLWVEPVVAAIAFAFIGGIYGAIYLVTRRPLKRLGQIRLEANSKRFRLANEALTGIKDIKLLGCEIAYIDRYSEPSVQIAQTQARVVVLSQVPPLALQAMSLGGVILLCLIMIDPSGIGSGAGLDGLLPVLGLFAFAGQRLIPEFSKAYQALAQIRAGSAAVSSVHEDLFLRTNDDRLLRLPVTGLGLKQGLQLDKISYSYPNSDQSGVSDISLLISAGEKIGIVGATGAGKTTLADVILGLLEPDRGRLVADGAEIASENVRSWMQSVGYVPQDIFLTDAPIVENIALGVPPGDIDHDRVRNAARIARIDRFILNEMPQGYQTHIGERGVRLSGGQRQRIGIARALYHDADLIVFDEATSALDNLTESEVMDAINSLPGDKTVLMIAHRLSTVKSCDLIVVLDKGRVVGCDNWSNLMESNSAFQRMARTGKIAAVSAVEPVFDADHSGPV
jgi:ABC-type multidrug transport system fused ATPase/permease subunit